MKLRIITEAYDKNLAQSICDKFDIEPRKLRDFVSEIDDTLTYGTWILKTIKSILLETGVASFWQVAEAFQSECKRLLEKFHIRKQEFPSQDINSYTFESLKEAAESISDTEKLDLKTRDGAQFLFSEKHGDNHYEVYIIKDPNILVEVAKGSSWCVRQLSMAKNYLARDNQIVVMRNGAATCLATATGTEIKNSGNVTENRPEVLALVKRAIRIAIAGTPDSRDWTVEDVKRLYDILKEERSASAEMQRFLDWQTMPQGLKKILLIDAGDVLRTQDALIKFKTLFEISRLSGKIIESYEQHLQNIWLNQSDYSRAFFTADIISRYYDNYLHKLNVKRWPFAEKALIEAAGSAIMSVDQINSLTRFTFSYANESGLTTWPELVTAIKNGVSFYMSSFYVRQAFQASSGMADELAAWYVEYAAERFGKVPLWDKGRKPSSSDLQLDGYTAANLTVIKSLSDRLKKPVDISRLLRNVPVSSDFTPLLMKLKDEQTKEDNDDRVEWYYKLVIWYDKLFQGDKGEPVPAVENSLRASGARLGEANNGDLYAEINSNNLVELINTAQQTLTDFSEFTANIADDYDASQGTAPLADYVIIYITNEVCSSEILPSFDWDDETFEIEFSGDDLRRSINGSATDHTAAVLGGQLDETPTTLGPVIAGTAQRSTTSMLIPAIYKQQIRDSLRDLIGLYDFAPDDFRPGEDGEFDYYE